MYLISVAWILRLGICATPKGFSVLMNSDSKCKCSIVRKYMDVPHIKLVIFRSEKSS